MDLIKSYNILNSHEIKYLNLYGDILSNLFILFDKYEGNPNFLDMIKEYCRANLDIINSTRSTNYFISLIRTPINFKHRIKLAQILIECGADINRSDHFGENYILHYTASCGDLEYLKLLLESGANPDIKDRCRGFTALYYATVNNHYYITKMILEYDAHPICNNYVMSIHFYPHIDYYKLVERNIALLNTKN